ncbi:MAG: trypsin-like peptidase domain-containing protein [Blastocatellia bacterium]|nr:trypsin-like peptidase domain-containing protein [Blastocatellia bacterium]MCS7156989.1 trypsin-like peptidase domain-containing protein [Blastocatellia bacterium]MCX7752190.1 trypsin-like peptidase domain-containing protein [Blastocatellia bacterium]MDW8167682.1 trypsin-like peptidase domain-containing protein [Acidobacteriota bacterium]MDW8256281.1 trypsin-like peptidase domain-containing protein [Acidobacteriota bacterium]
MMEIRLTHIGGGYAGRQEVLSKDRITFGRSADNDVRLHPQDVRASAHHAVLFASDEGVIVEDLNSTNGTYVNGVRVHRTRIQSGDVLQFGRRGPSVMVEILVPAEEPQSATVTPPTLVESATSSVAWRVGRTTVQLMIEHAMRRSARVWRRWVIGVAAGAIVALGIVLGILWRDERERSASVEGMSPLVRVAMRNQAAVVLIQHHFRILDARGREVSTAVSEGSGFAIDPRGVIATNYHLVRPWEFDARFAGQATTPVSQSLKVIFADRAPDEALEARLVRGSPELDIALLKVDAPIPLPIVEGFEPDLSRVRQGDEVAIIGFPLGSALLQTTGQERATTTLTRSTISKVSPTLLQLDAPVIQGYSGSPIFNREGKVIGILTARLGERGEPIDPSARAIGLGTPSRFLLQLLKEVP